MPDTILFISIKRASSIEHNGGQFLEACFELDHG